MIQPSRRSFITGLTSLIVTAPAIVRASSLMPVKAMRSAQFIPVYDLLDGRIVSVNVVSAGSGYRFPPTITFSQTDNGWWKIDA